MKSKRNEEPTQKSKAIGKGIRWLRYTKRLSLREVAVLLDISAPALPKIENGTTGLRKIFENNPSDLRQLLLPADLIRTT